jgi:hypothetical protein
VRWTFLWSDAEFHTMAWEEGASLSTDMWQAPPYCFTQGPDAPGGGGSSGGDSAGVLDNPLASGRMMRLQAAKPAAAPAKVATS